MGLVVYTPPPNPADPAYAGCRSRVQCHLPIYPFLLALCYTRAPLAHTLDNKKQAPARPQALDPSQRKLDFVPAAPKTQPTAAAATAAGTSMKAEQRSGAVTVSLATAGEGVAAARSLPQHVVVDCVDLSQFRTDSPPRDSAVPGGTCAAALPFEKSAPPHAASAFSKGGSVTSVWGASHQGGRQPPELTCKERAGTGAAETNEKWMKQAVVLSSEQQVSVAARCVQVQF